MKIISLLITVGLLAFFGWMITRLSEAAVHQHYSESFPHVSGVVESSEVTTTQGSKGKTHYHVHIRYRYSVEGVDYIGYRYRYDGHPTDARSANAIVAAHRPGTAVEVYYNPQNPRDSVLSTRMDEADVALPLFIGGISLFLLGTIVPGMRQLFLGANPVAGGVRIIPEMMVTRVRLPRYEPLKLGLMTAGGLSLLAAILIVTGELHPPWQAAQWSLMVLLLGGAAVYAMHYHKLRSGRQDLVINEAGRTMQLPLTFKRREQTQVSFSDVRDVLLNKVRHSRRGGSYYTYLVTLELKNNTLEKLVDLNLARAKTFASWLKEKLGLTGPPLEVDPKSGRQGT